MSHKGARPAGEFLLYAAAEGQVRLSVYFEGETVRLTQKMAELFDVKVPAIAKHPKNIFDSGELLESEVISILETTANEGKSYKTDQEVARLTMKDEK